MIESAVAAAVTDRLEPIDPSPDWIVALTTDPTGRIDAGGVAWAERGPLRVFVDGVLYDRDALARDSGESVHAPDARLLAAGFARHGDALIARLRGRFVVVVVDTTRNVATVIRDHVGSHPVFYATARGALLLSSSQQALLAQPGVSRDLNRIALADHLCQRWPMLDETYYAAIKRVPPGCRLVLERGRLRVERYWNQFDGPVQYLSAAEADRFDEHFARAVGRCFGDGRVGIFLSGGLDSVSVAAMAADHARQAGDQHPVALSLGFPHRDCDERPVQTAVAERLGMPQELMPFDAAAGERGLLETGLELSAQLGTPLFNTWFPAYLALARQGTAHGVKTILTGEGGDEWLTVSPYLCADLIRQGDLAGLVRMARSWHRSVNTKWFWVTWGTVWRFGLRPLVGSAAAALGGERWDRNRTQRRLAGDPSWITPDPGVRRAQAERAQSRVVDARPANGFYARELQWFVGDPLMSIFFEEQHELGRQCGVRFAHPYWDADLVEHLYRTPPEVLLRGDRTKGLVRNAVERRFPGLGLASQRKVLAFSFFASKAGEARRLAPLYTDFTALADLGIVEPAGAKGFVDGAFERSPRTMVQAWRLVTLEAWARAQHQ
jgi:asparagine synthase (glutamine-hydrolysing)